MEHATHAVRERRARELLQYWRRARNLSRSALAHDAEVSPRHVSFETGRAKPSRDMVLLLADTLDVPLRERNALLLAAGFAPMFRESTLDDREYASPHRNRCHPETTGALSRGCHEPTLGHRCDQRRGDALLSMLLDGRTPHGAGNILRLMFHPDGLRPFVENGRRWHKPSSAVCIAKRSVELSMTQDRSFCQSA